MVKLIHTAYVHLKADEQDYGLAVLREIVGIATGEHADFLLICGDLFDSFADAYALRHEVAEVVKTCPDGMEILYIPGNHEEHGKTTGLATLDFGKLRPITASPFSLLERTVRGEPVEFLVVGYAGDYSGWREWGVRPPVAPCRIALVHAMVQSLAYAGPEAAEPEEDGTIMGSEFFLRTGVGYAALGHVHGRREVRQGEALLAYPGSATVWRRGERGPRCVSVVEVSGKEVRTVEKPLGRAGEYRQVEIPLSLDGSLPGDLDQRLAPCGADDLAELIFTGVVEDEHSVESLVGAVRSRLGTRTREPIIRTERVEVFSGLAQQALAGLFVQALGQHQPAGVRPEALARARELGLLSIKKIMGGAR